MTSGSAQAKWQVARSDHFIVYSGGGTAQLRDFADKLERFDFLLRQLTRVTDEDGINPVKIFLVANIDSVSRLKGGNVAGFYSASEQSGFAVVPRSAGVSQFDLQADEILFHEYAHHFMLHHLPYAYPAWYVEGFAEYYSTTEFRPNGEIWVGRVPMARARDLAWLTLFPVRDLLESRTDETKEGRDRARYYATSWLLAHYFRNDEKRSKEFSAYLRAIGEGKSGEALEAVFDGGASALETDLQKYWKRNRFPYNRYAVKQQPQFTIVIEPLPEEQEALIHEEIETICCLKSEPPTRLLDDVRGAARRYPASAYANALLAELELKAGNDDASLVAAERAISIDSTNSRALLSKARVLMERASATDDGAAAETLWKEALRSIVSANRGNPDDPAPLAEYYRYHMRRGLKIPEIAYDGLDKAFSLLPQSPDLRFLTSAAYASLMEFDAAYELLGPLANSPHPSPMRDAAIKLRAEYRLAQEKLSDKAPSKAQ